MKIAFLLNNEVQFAQFLAYAAEHGLDASRCMKPKFVRYGFGYYISWSDRVCYGLPLDILKASGYYIADEVRIQLTDYGEYEIFVTIDYEHIYN